MDRVCRQARPRRLSGRSSRSRRLQKPGPKRDPPTRPRVPEQEAWCPREPASKEMPAAKRANRHRFPARQTADRVGMQTSVSFMTVRMTRPEVTWASCDDVTAGKATTSTGRESGDQGRDTVAGIAAEATADTVTLQPARHWDRPPPSTELKKVWGLGLLSRGPTPVYPATTERR